MGEDGIERILSEINTEAILDIPVTLRASMWRRKTRNGSVVLGRPLTGIMRQLTVSPKSVNAIHRVL